jgi:hypothetical protein
MGRPDRFFSQAFARSKRISRRSRSPGCSLCVLARASADDCRATNQLTCSAQIESDVDARSYGGGGSRRNLHVQHRYALALWGMSGGFTPHAQPAA